MKNYLNRFVIFLLMVKVVQILKTGELASQNLKKLDYSELYKLCGYKNNNNFNRISTWKFEMCYISLFGKDKGRANSENKYDLPPPLDNELYFGKLLLVKHNEEEFNFNELCDLSLEEWNNHYATLFGGFESLGDEEFSSEEEIDADMLTKEGYSKEDGFIVDDDEEEEEYLPEEEEEEEEYEEEDEDADADGSFNGEEYTENDTDGSELSEESYESD